MERTRMRLRTDGHTNGRHADRYIPPTYRSRDKKILVIVSGCLQLTKSHGVTVPKVNGNWLYISM